MPRMFDNFNINEIFYKENVTDTLQTMLNQTQRVFEGYQYLYFNYEGTDNLFETYLTCEMDKKKSIKFLYINLQSPNNIVWDLKVVHLLESNYSDYVSVMCTKSPNEEGYFPVCIINPDVLPCISSGSVIKAQICFYAYEIDFFSSDEKLDESFPVMNDKSAVEMFRGKRISIAEGALLPQFNMTKGVSKEDRESFLFRSRVKSYKKRTYFFKEKEYEYYAISCACHYGEVELYVSPSQFNKKALKEGAPFLASCIISADPAIDDYENGALYDEKHLLLLIKEALNNNYYDRLLKVMDTECTYTSDWSNKKIQGNTEIVDYLSKTTKNRMNKQMKNNFQLSYLSGMKEKFVGAYPIGKICLRLNEEKILLFAEIKNEKIAHLFLTNEKNYTASPLLEGK